MNDLISIGWREWIAMPDINVPGIKAKVDTGARTSAIHTCTYELYKSGGVDRVKFSVHPLPHNTELMLEGDAKLVDMREVRDSGGHTELRPFIMTRAVMGDFEWEIEVNLTNRENMKFRMLLGREGMDPFLVNPSLSYLKGKKYKYEQ